MKWQQRGMSFLGTNRKLRIVIVQLCNKTHKKNRPWQDSNLQSPDPKSGALSIRPHGLYVRWLAPITLTLTSYQRVLQWSGNEDDHIQSQRNSLLELNMIAWGPVAQWTRHLTTNQGIAGSSPARINIFTRAGQKHIDVVKACVSVLYSVSHVAKLETGFKEKCSVVD